MCGIAAIFTSQPGDPANRRLLRQMHDTLAHRGPDGEGWVLVPPRGAARVRHGSMDGGGGTDEAVLSIACRRLSIQDPSPGAALPLGSEDGQVWIALNGEIYNFGELRRELEAEGFRFRTRGDTEVALAAYQHWGEGCWERFNGMWAILIADLSRRKLVGCRDRLGIKPLYFAHDGKRLLFASEPKAIARVMEGGPRIHPYRFHEYLRGLPPQSTSHSFFAGIDPVPAGTWFELDLGAEPRPPARFVSFWNPRGPAEGNGHPPSLESSAEELAHELRRSVRLRLQSDAPLGGLLSGGLDSSTVTRLAVEARNGDGTYPTLSLTYDDPAMDESRFIDAVLEGGGATSEKVRYQPEECWAGAGACIEAQGEPILGWDLIAQHHAYGRARERGLKVLLEGQGGDELLGGYALYEFDMLRDRLDRGDLPGFTRELRGLARMYGRPAWRVLRFQVANRLRLNRVLAGRGSRPPWLDGEDPPRPESGAFEDRSIADPERLNRSLFESTVKTNLPCVLLHQDRNSMAHGIESRVPFLDHNVVELCFRMPGIFKIHDGTRKRVLRQAGRGLLPPAVLERTDKMAMISSPAWFPIKDHGEELREAAADRRLGELPWIDGAAAAAHVEGFLSGRHSDQLSVWRLYATARWIDLFKPSF